MSTSYVGNIDDTDVESTEIEEDRPEVVIPQQPIPRVGGNLLRELPPAPSAKAKAEIYSGATIKNQMQQYRRVRQPTMPMPKPRKYELPQVRQPELPRPSPKPQPMQPRISQYRTPKYSEAPIPKVHQSQMPKVKQPRYALPPVKKQKPLDIPPPHWSLSLETPAFLRRVNRRR